MVKGVLGIILCPMLEDELLYSLKKDRDIDRIVLLQNRFSALTHDKMKKRGIEFEYLPEEAFDQGRMEFDRSIYNVVIKCNDLALHAEPPKLKDHITQQVRDIQPLVDAVGLYYGICGNFGWDIVEWARKEGLKPTSVFRGDDGKVCDDCVAVAIGGSTNYNRFIKRYTGIFFLTPAIANNWEVFVMAGDSAKALESIPKETLADLGIHNQMDFMRWMFEVGHYENLLKMDTGLDPDLDMDKRADEIGKMLNLKPIQIEDGWLTLSTAEAIYADCKSHMPA